MTSEFIHEEVSMLFHSKKFHWCSPGEDLDPRLTISVNNKYMYIHKISRTRFYCTSV